MKINLTKLALTATLGLAITLTLFACEDKEKKQTTAETAAAAAAAAEAEKAAQEAAVAAEADRAAKEAEAAEAYRAAAQAAAEKVVKSSLTDSRDKKTYKIIKIGNQNWWMAENLNYETKSGSWCYENKADSCKKYGRLYDWVTAKTVCPAGWRLPFRDEWYGLIMLADGSENAGSKLKSNSGWNDYCDSAGEDRTCFDGGGSDNYGFSALPGGRGSSDGGFYDVGENGYWWTAEDNSDGAYARKMNLYHGGGSDYVDEENSAKEGVGFSVRCILN